MGSRRSFNYCCSYGNSIAADGDVMQATQDIPDLKAKAPPDLKTGLSSLINMRW
jgi:hypothetical protein